MKTKRTKLAFILLTVLTVTAYAQYTPEKYFKVEKIDNGTAIKITKYTGKDVVVNIPPVIRGLPVTEIGDGAFAEKKKGDYYSPKYPVTDVTFPESVTSIGEYAFYYNKLTSLTIPDIRKTERFT